MVYAAKKIDKFNRINDFWFERWLFEKKEIFSWWNFSASLHWYLYPWSALIIEIYWPSSHSLTDWASLSFSAQLFKKIHMPSKLSACISLNKLSKILFSLLGTNLDTWTPNIDGLADGLVWLQAVCTSPQKAIVVLQKKLFRWILCIKSI